MSWGKQRKEDKRAQTTVQADHAEACAERNAVRKKSDSSHLVLTRGRAGAKEQRFVTIFVTRFSGAPRPRRKALEGEKKTRRRKGRTAEKPSRVEEDLTKVPVERNAGRKEAQAQEVS